MARQYLNVLFMALVSCAAFAHGSRQLQSKAATTRELWIDPTIKPTSTTGYMVVLSIVCPGKYNTVDAIELRSGLIALGFPNAPSNLAFGGMNALAGFQFMVSYTVNIPGATTQAAALAAVAKVTGTSLAAASKTKVTSVSYSTYAASG